MPRALRIARETAGAVLNIAGWTLISASRRISGRPPETCTAATRDWLDRETLR